MDTNRLEALSDGVIAIAITFLVLEITVPEAPGSLRPTLLNLWSSYFAFLPLPTAVLARTFSHGSDQAVAAAFYGSVLTVMGITVMDITVNVMWRYAAHGHRLLDAETTPVLPMATETGGGLRARRGRDVGTALSA
jgi:uncharacterized membrane protein